ncbi:hypothetical protein D3C85_1595640 [compost metagenome]
MAERPGGWITEVLRRVIRLFAIQARSVMPVDFTIMVFAIMRLGYSVGSIRTQGEVLMG